MFLWTETPERPVLLYMKFTRRPCIWSRRLFFITRIKKKMFLISHKHVHKFCQNHSTFLIVVIHSRGQVYVPESLLSADSQSMDQLTHAVYYFCFYIWSVAKHCVWLQSPYWWDLVNPVCQEMDCICHLVLGRCGISAGFGKCSESQDLHCGPGLWLRS